MVCMKTSIFQLIISDNEDCCMKIHYLVGIPFHKNLKFII